MQLETLGNVLTCGLVIAALIVVPVKLWRVWWPVVMSKLFGSAGEVKSTNAPVHVPVQADQYAPVAADSVIAENGPDLPDTDAANTGTDWQPRLPRYPTEEELVIYLATIRDAQGKYLRSANKIAEFSSLHRNEVLKLVREVREGVPQYPQLLTAEQAATRKKLALD